MKNADQLLKIKATVLYLLGQAPEGMDYIHLSKLMYFAQKEHLVTYGLPVMDDSFFARKHGPVPRLTYRVLKQAESGTAFDDPVLEGFRAALAVEQGEDHPVVKALEQYDEDELSRSDIKSLDQAIAQYLNTDAYELGRLSHDKAWRKAKRIADRTGEDVRIPLYDIAEAGGASRGMLDVIKERQWIENSLSN